MKYLIIIFFGRRGYQRLTTTVGKLFTYSLAFSLYHQNRKNDDPKHIRPDIDSFPYTQIGRGQVGFDPGAIPCCQYAEYDKNENDCQ